MTKETKAGLIGAGIFAALFGLLSLDDLLLSRIGNFIQGNVFWLIWALPLIVAIAVAVTLWPSYDYSYSSTDYRSKPKKKTNWTGVTVAALTGLACLCFLVYAVFTHGYQVRKAVLANVSETTNTAPQFKERAAFTVADKQAAGNLGEGVIGEIVDTTYVADQDTFGSLVERPGFFTGYAAVETQTVALTGQATAQTCKFSTSDADARLGGIFGSSLERKIAHIHRGYTITDSDAYGVCVDQDGKKTPLVIVPLKDHRGWFPAIEVPAGVAVYNGLTGTVKVYDDVKAGQLPGPVFPLSLAQDLRESTAAMGSFWDFMKNRSGYSDTSRDENDPNGENRSEFALATASSKSPAYVSPLTARRGSTAISAIGVVQAGSVTKGKFNAYTVHKLDEPRKANSAVADRLKTDYSDLPDWASGLRIFEIAPVSQGEWVASMGREQNVAYRVRIKADGSSCLENADGTKIRCGRSTNTNGNGPGMSLAPADGTPVSVPVDGELSKLSDADLAKLQTQLAGEISRRLTATK